MHTVGMEALSRFDPEYPGPPDVWFADTAAIGMLAELELAAGGARSRICRTSPRTLGCR
jgi:hypothetical protein